MDKNKRSPIYRNKFTKRKGKNVPPIKYGTNKELHTIITEGIIRDPEIDFREFAKGDLPTVVIAVDHPNPRPAEVSESELKRYRNGKFLVDIDFKNDENSGLNIDLVRLKMRRFDILLPSIDHRTFSGGLRLFYDCDDGVLQTYSHAELMEATRRVFLSIGVEIDTKCFDLKHFAFINHDSEAIYNGDNEDYQPLNCDDIARWLALDVEDSTQKQRDATTRQRVTSADFEIEEYADIPAKILRMFGECSEEYGEPKKGCWDNHLKRFVAKCANIAAPDEIQAAGELLYSPYNNAEADKIRTKLESSIAHFKQCDNAKHNEEERVRDERLKPDALRVRRGDEIPDPIPVLTSFDEEIIVSESNILFLLGKAKVGKGFLLSLLIAGYINDRDSLRDGEILYFDTEQGASHVQRVLRRLYKMVENVAEDGFIIYALRPLDTKDRAEFVERECRRWKPRLVIIDGIVDLCSDFLDLRASTATIQQLMTLTHEIGCAAVAVLHENKLDNNGRGHLGSIGTQKAETVANLTKIKSAGVTQVEFTYTRNKPPQPFTFAIDEEGLPYVSTHGLAKVPKDYSLFADVLVREMGYMELVVALAAKTKQSDRTAKRKIKNATEAGYISEQDGKYKLLPMGISDTDFE